MTPPHRPQHARAKEIFAAAAELPREERPAFVAAQAGGDVALEAHVVRLLAALEGPEAFLREPTAISPPRSGEEVRTADATPGETASSASPFAGEEPGASIGGYRLLQLIGEGGFGRVFMAEQDRPVRRKVAFKIIKLGMDTRQVVARFEQERQALAVMDHPHIAKVFDGGATESGRPYFVMELCGGEAITTYCDRNSLSLPERLELFQQVCQAVHHAHQKGVIHRDIKPSNVLVSTHDGRPFAKVIDFGIAKATQARFTERTLFTEHRQLIGTPEYMSPEQAQGSLDIDTRTDVYSLGVLLYELISGSTPFSPEQLRSAAFGEIQRIIREVEPPTPSARLVQNSDTIAGVAARRRIEPRQLGTLVRGELDWIVMKALEKDRARRYDSPSSLAADIARHLNGDPVQAAPPSAVYRARKIVLRHLGKVIAAALVGLTLIVGATGTAIGFVRASHERDQSRAAQADAEAVTDYLTRVLASADPGAMGKNATVRQVIDEAAQKLDPAIRARPAVEARIREAIGRTYLALGEYTQATSNAAQAWELGRATFGEDSEHTIRMAELLGRSNFYAGKYELAEQQLRSTLEQASARLGPQSEPALSAMTSLAMLFSNTGRLAEAETGFRAAAAGFSRLKGPDDTNTLNALGSLAVVLADQGKHQEAEAAFLDAERRMTRALGAEHPTTLANANNYAWALQARGESERAVEINLRVLEGRRRVLGPDHPETMQSESNLGVAYRSLNRLDEATALAVRSLEYCRRHLGDEHPETLTTMANLARLQTETGSPDQALPLFVEAEAGFRKLVGPDHPYAAQTTLGLGICLRKMERHEEAMSKLTEAFDTLSKAGPTMQSAARRAAQELAMTSQALGRDEEVANWRETAERLTPTQP